MNFELPLRPGDAKREPVTLRDMFAAAAMQGLISGLLANDESSLVETLTGDAPTHLSHIAYKMAEAMLKERAK
jgi:hypothetical protein